MTITATTAPPKPVAATNEAELATLHAAMKDIFVQYMATRSECWLFQLRARIPRQMALTRFRLLRSDHCPLIARQVSEGEDVLAREVLAILLREGACTLNEDNKVICRQEDQPAGQATGQSVDSTAALDHQENDPAEAGSVTDLGGSSPTDTDGLSESVSPDAPCSLDQNPESQMGNEAGLADGQPDGDTTIEAAELDGAEVTKQEADPADVKGSEASAPALLEEPVREGTVNSDLAGAKVAPAAEGGSTPTTLDIDLIHLDSGTQVRTKIDEKVVAEYAEAMRTKTEFPPIVVFFDGVAYWLADGYHRVKAATEVGRQSIAADVRQGTQRDAILYAVGANASHGLRRRNADKRRAVTLLLTDAEWSRWSDREIARRCAVSDRLVNSVRAGLAGASANGSQMQDARRKAKRKGKTYTVRTGRIGSNHRKKSDHLPKGADGAEAANHPSADPKGIHDAGQAEPPPGSDPAVQDTPPPAGRTPPCPGPAALEPGPQSGPPGPEADGQAGLGSDPASGGSVAPADAPEGERGSVPVSPDKLWNLTISLGSPQAMAEALVRQLGRDLAGEVRDAMTVILDAPAEDH